MVGETVKNILEAENKAEGILRDAEAMVCKIEAKSQANIQNLKTSHAKLLNEVIKKMSDENELENNKDTNNIKTDKAQIDEAVKYIITNLLGGERC